MKIRSAIVMISVSGALMHWAGGWIQNTGAMSSDTTTAYAQDGCTGILNGARTPHLIPDFYAWAALWAFVEPAAKSGSLAARRRVADELRIDEEFMDTIVAAKDRLTTRGSQLPTSQASSEQGMRGLGSTDDGLSLDARDELVRTLPSRQYERLLEWVDAHRSELTYSFGSIGTLLPPTPAGARQCRVSVSGKDYPELIPESYYWEIYFRTRASVAASHREASGLLDADYVRVLQKHHLPIPAEEIELVVKVASRAVERIESLSEPATSTALAVDNADWIQRERIRTVSQARDELVRKLPSASWLVIQRDADRMRAGTIFDFPPG